MDTLNNQLIKLGAKVGNKVLVDNWEGKVIMNEWGLGISMITSHDPRPLCDGIFPEINDLKLYHQ